MCVMGGRGWLHVLGAELASQRCFQMFCWVYFIFYFFFPSWCEATGSLPWLVQREQMCAVIRIITPKKPFSLPKSFPQEQGTQRAATRRGASFPGEMEPGGFGGSWGSMHGPPLALQHPAPFGTPQSCRVGTSQLREACGEVPFAGPNRAWNKILHLAAGARRISWSDRDGDGDGGCGLCCCHAGAAAAGFIG